MTKEQENSRSQASLLKRAMCDWSCRSIRVEPIEDWLAVDLRVQQSSGHFFKCFVRMPVDGKPGLVSDWGEIQGELFLNGIHSSALLSRRAASLGLSENEHGIFSRPVPDLTQVALGVSALEQLAAIAAAELETISFTAPSMVLPAAWANLMTARLRKERHAVVISDYPKALAPRSISRHTWVALYDDRPVLASPYLRLDSRSWFESLYYFLSEADEALKAVVPLIRADGEGLGSGEREDLTRIAQGKGRYLDIVQVSAQDARFSADRQDYPAMEVFEAAGRRVVAAYDQGVGFAA